jgi:hypothetical protein
VRSFKWSFMALLIGFLAICYLPAAPEQKFATVTFRVLDSFGNAQSDCRLLEFVLLDDDRGTNYVSHFSGAFGRNIPYGSTYRTHVKCADERTGGTFLVSVNRPEVYLVLASWPNIGDYVTGPAPRLTIALKRGGRVDLTTGAWIKLVGTFVDRSEVDKFAADSGSARFFHIVPGQYLLLLFIGDKLACTKKIDFLDPPANLELSLNGQSCVVEGQHAVKATD